ncbi:prephenate dehydrogenase/arogenate dehydrogenase family protein [Scytonema sp. PRP1]|uniref:prephenate dehydrogenase/arogenate dehydrogenase family protein n=1 Tax=Scytonema sp. PRP1 TaxID=3120513 RepID=UPI002FD32405
MNIEKVLILGLNGGFGKLFSNLLAEEGLSIFGIDLAPQPDKLAKCARYLCGDLSQPDKNMLAIARQVDCLLICLPESVAFVALEHFIPAMSADALIVDTLSVKTTLAEKVTNIREDLQLLSINPMFAPDLGFRDNNVVTVQLSSGLRSDNFISLMEKWGAHVTSMTASEHDRQTAITQVATHAAIISFGICLTELGYDPNKALPISTPVHRTLLALFARITNQAPEIYWRIQVDNPYAAQAREAMSASLKQLADMAYANHQQEFYNALTRSKETLSPCLEELIAYASRIFQI